MCGISVKVGDEWIIKWDGGDNTNIEATKGGFSVALKRAAVQWGIGRYLYSVDEFMASIKKSGATPQYGGTIDTGVYRGEAKKKDGSKVFFTWNPPTLPEWALPHGDNGTGAGKEHGEDGSNGGEPDRHITKEEWEFILSCLMDMDIKGIGGTELCKKFNVKKGGDLMVSDVPEISKWMSLEVDKSNQ